MSMIRKRSHSNTNVSKKEKPPQQESGMALPFSSHVDYSLGTAHKASEKKIKLVSVGTDSDGNAYNVNINNCYPCPSIFIYLAVQKCDCSSEAGSDIFGIFGTASFLEIPSKFA